MAKTDRTHVRTRHLGEPRTETDDGPTHVMQVTAVLGEVVLGPTDGEHPAVAGMRLIAEHDAAGSFLFEIPGVYKYAVTVERDEPPRDNGKATRDF